MANLRAAVESISFKNYRELDADEARLVLSIRNEPSIRECMYDDHVISLEEHFAWLEGLRDSKTSIILAVFFDEEIVGSIGLTNISVHNQRADWTFHLSGSTQGKGLGSAVEYKFLNHVFDELGIFKLNGEVLDFNTAVLALHKKFGFVEEGFRRSHIVRGSERHGVHLIGLTRDEWHARRDELEQRLFR